MLNKNNKKCTYYKKKTFIKYISIVYLLLNVRSNGNPPIVTSFVDTMDEEIASNAFC
jgi:hypothetical protein